MPRLPPTGSARHHLRFVLEGPTLHLRFVPDATSGEIARVCSEIAARHTEPPVAMDRTFAASPIDRTSDGRAAMAWLPAHLAWGAGKNGTGL
jgi:hypothetical protein